MLKVQHKLEYHVSVKLGHHLKVQTVWEGHRYDHNLEKYLDDLKIGTRTIKVNNYIKYQIESVENGHNISILTGNEKDLNQVVVQKFMCRWPKNRNPRTKPFTHGKKEV